MDASEISYGILILIEIIIGMWRNVILLLVYAHVVFTNHKMNPSDLILAQLALANTIILLTLGIPETMSAWGLRNFLDAVGCKILFYLFRVGQGLAICTTCLLSIFQAITIIPGTSRWVRVKARTLPSCLFPWVLSLLIDVSALLYMEEHRNITNIEMTFIFIYCFSTSPNSHHSGQHRCPLLWDLFFMRLMSAASSYMVLLLYRYHWQVQHLHGPGCYPRVMPEVRAAKCVVSLVTFYVLLFGQATVTLSILINMRKKSPQLVNSFKVLSFTFSVISPFLSILNNQRMRMFGRRTSLISNFDSSTALKEVA
ncbi:vomeronasal 1 receptor ornAnaV1R3279 [Ornithorhynchus anatinus]|uniref:vomeronasal 1 receptor ornAnaV1R3279 n=1 Tax=Ornithorhynchus anatinus TaxID=9258 RepID=UPI000155CC4C|nr:vomeronasal 1 receptor ornAnaV1R3279 [Ornithorhynchus anatinus]